LQAAQNKALEEVENPENRLVRKYQDEKPTSLRDFVTQKVSISTQKPQNYQRLDFISWKHEMTGATQPTLLRNQSDFAARNP
jgi:hypothetical protein